MKTLSNKELKAKADQVFKVNNADTLHCTSDGQCFVEENRAVLHSRSTKPVMSITTFKKEVLKPEASAEKTEGDNQDPPKQDFELRAEAVSQAATIEEVNELLKDEKSKTVQKAGAARIAELKLVNHGDVQKPEGGSPKLEDGKETPASETKTEDSETKTEASEKKEDKSNTENE